MLKKFIFAGLGLALMSMSGVANAGPIDPVIWDNGAPDIAELAIGSDVNSGNPKGITDDFTLDVHAVITDVHWWGFFRGVPGLDPDDPDSFPLEDLPEITDFALAFFKDDAGAPGDGILSFMVHPGIMVVEGQVNSLGWQLFEFWVVIDPLKFGGGTQWISIIDIDNNTPDFFMASSTDGLTGNPNAYLRFLDPAENFVLVVGPQEQNFDMAFNLTGKIPEPAALALFGFGLMGIGLARRRRRTV